MFKQYFQGRAGLLKRLWMIGVAAFVWALLPYGLAAPPPTTPYRSPPTNLSDNESHAPQTFAELQARVMELEFTRQRGSPVYPELFIPRFNQRIEDLKLYQLYMNKGVSQEHLYFPVLIDELRIFQNVDQIVGYAIYVGLVRRFYEEHFPDHLVSSADSSKLKGKFAELDLEVLERLFQLGYDPREFNKWFLATARESINARSNENLLTQVLYAFFYRAFFDMAGSDERMKEESEGHALSKVNGLLPEDSAKKRAVAMIHWLQAREAKVNFADPTPLPREMEVVARPASLPKVTSTGLLDHILRQETFQALAEIEKIRLLNVLCFPAAHRAPRNFFDPFFKSAFIWEIDSNPDLMERIDGMVRSLGSKSSDDATRIQAMAHFRQRVGESSEDMERILSLFDGISPRPDLNNFSGYLKHMQNAGRFHPFQKLAALFDIIANSNDIPDMIQALTEVGRIIDSKSGLVVNSWFEKKFIRPLLKKFKQVTQAEQDRISTALAPYVHRFSIKLQQRIRNELNEKERPPTGAILAPYIEGGGRLLESALGATETFFADTWRRSTGRPTSAALEAKTRYPKIFSLLEAARANENSAEVYAIFQTLSESKYFSEDEQALRVEPSLIEKFIGAVYAHGKGEEKAGLNWPMILRAGPSITGNEFGWVLQREIAAHLKKLAPQLPGTELIPILILIAAELFPNERDQPPPAYTEFRAYGLSLDHIIEYLTSRMRNQGVEARVDRWLSFYLDPSKLSSFIFSNNHFFENSEVAWPRRQGNVLFQRIMAVLWDEIHAASTPEASHRIIDFILDRLAPLLNRKDLKTEHRKLDAVLTQSMEQLRYRELPQNLAEYSDRLDSHQLTLEERQTSLYEMLRQARTPAEHAELLPYILALNTAFIPRGALDAYEKAQLIEHPQVNRYFFVRFGELFRARLPMIYEGAVALKMNEFVKGLNWPDQLLRGPENDEPHPEVNKLYFALSKARSRSAFHRMQILSGLKNAPKKLGFGELDIFEALLDSPHFEAMQPNERTWVLERLHGTFAVNGDNRVWRALYLFFRAHRLTNEARPKELISILTDSNNIPAEWVQQHGDNYKGPSTQILSPALRDAFKDAVRTLIDTQSFALNETTLGRAAVLLDTLDSGRKLTLQTLAPLQRSGAPTSIEEFARRNGQTVGGRPLLDAEIDEALGAFIRRAQTPEEFILILQQLHDHSIYPSAELRKLVTSHLGDFFEAALATRNFKVLHLREDLWPGWMEIWAVNHRTTIWRQQRALRDARLPGPEAAMLLYFLRSIRTAERIPMANDTAELKQVCQRMTDRQEFLRLLNDPLYYERLIANFSMTKSLNADPMTHYRRFMKESWIMDEDFVRALLASDHLWVRSDGSEMGRFISQSTEVAMHARIQLQARDARTYVERLKQDLELLKNHEVDRLVGLSGFSEREVEDDDVGPDPWDTRFGHHINASDPARMSFIKRHNLINQELDSRREKLGLLLQEEARLVVEIAHMESAAEAVKQSSRSGPAYSYRLDLSESMQRYIISQMQAQGTYPTSPDEQMRLTLALARRGATAFTDSELHRLISREGFHNVNALAEIMQEHLIWDFAYRRQAHLKLESLTGDQARRILEIRSRNPAARAVAIYREIEFIKKRFPEDSEDRAELLEQLSADVGSTHEEAREIHASKHDVQADSEASGLTLFTYLESRLRTSEDKLAFIRFFQGKGILPAPIREIVEQGIGEARLLRQFQNISPELRGIFMTHTIGPPFGIMMREGSTAIEEDQAMRMQLIELIVGEAGEYKEDAKYLLDALLYAIERTEPHSKYMIMGFLLGQVGRVGGSLGEKLVVALGALGGTGQSLGQIFVQRRMFSDDVLKFLERLQDSGRMPHRLEIFDQIAELLNVVNVDDLLEFQSTEGSGTARVIIKIKVKSEAILARLHRMGFDLGANGENIVAMKFLRKGFKRSTQREIQKMNFFLEHLERPESPPKFRRLRGPIEELQRSLLVQGDLSLEAKAFEKMRELYENQNQETAANLGLIFRVVRPDSEATSEDEYAYEELADGTGLRALTRSLPEPELRRIMKFIYDKEISILFAEPDENGLIHFEDDRHMGNFRVNLSRNPVEVLIFDYPLIASITAQKREAVLKLLGILERASELQLRVIPPTMMELILQEFERVIETPALMADSSKREALRASFRQTLDTLSLRRPSGQRSGVHMLLDLVAAGSGQEIPTDSSVYSYLKALGYLERYAEGQAEYKALLRGKISSLFTSTGEPTVLDRCAGALSETLNFIGTKVGPGDVN